MEKLICRLNGKPPKTKWRLLALVNALPFMLNVAFSLFGALFLLFGALFLNFALFLCGVVFGVLLFLPCYVFLTILNYKICEKTLHYILMHIYIMICTAVSYRACGHLYWLCFNDNYLNAVFFVLTFISIMIILLTAAITGIVKGIRRILRSKAENPQN